MTLHKSLATRFLAMLLIASSAAWSATKNSEDCSKKLTSTAQRYKVLKRQYNTAKDENNPLDGTIALLEMMQEKKKKLELSMYTASGLKVYRDLLKEQRRLNGTRNKAIRVLRELKPLSTLFWANGPWMVKALFNLSDRLTVRGFASGLEKRVATDAKERAFAAKLGIPADPFFFSILDTYLDPPQIKKAVADKQKGSILLPASLSLLLSLSSYDARAFFDEATTVPSYSATKYFSDIFEKEHISANNKDIVFIVDPDMFKSSEGSSFFHPSRGLRSDFFNNADLVLSNSWVANVKKLEAKSFRVIPVSSAEEAAVALNETTDADIRVMLFHGWPGYISLDSKRLTDALLTADIKPAKPGSVLIFESCLFGDTPVDQPSGTEETWIQLAKKIQPLGKTAAATSVVTIPFDTPVDYQGASLTNDVKWMSLAGKIENFFRYAITGPSIYYGAYKNKQQIESAGQRHGQVGFRVYDGETNVIREYPVLAE